MLLLFLRYFFVPCGKWGSPYLGKTTAAARAALPHAYQCVQYFPVSKQWYACQCLGSLTCAQMLMHALARGGCTDTVRVCTGADSGRKIPCHTGVSNPCQCHACLFCQALYQLSYRSPHQHMLMFVCCPFACWVLLCTCLCVSVCVSCVLPVCTHLQF